MRRAVIKPWALEEVPPGLLVQDRYSMRLPGEWCMVIAANQDKLNEPGYVVVSFCDVRGNPYLRRVELDWLARDFVRYKVEGIDRFCGVVVWEDPAEAGPEDPNKWYPDLD